MMVEPAEFLDFGHAAAIGDVDVAWFAAVHGRRLMRSLRRSWGRRQVRW
jgi:hypothetical protein